LSRASNFKSDVAVNKVFTRCSCCQNAGDRYLPYFACATLPSPEMTVATPKKNKAETDYAKRSSSLFVPTNAHKFLLIVKLLKSFKIITVAPTCFGLHKPSSGSSHSLRFAKVTVLIPIYKSLFGVFSVMAA